MVDFAEILEEGNSVFKDKGALSPHYVPESLLYRDEEIKKIMICLAPALKGQKAKNLFVYGKTGTGKTVSTKHVLDKLLQQGNPRVFGLYMNCRVYDSRYKILQKTITEFHPDIAKTGYSFAVLYEKFLDWLEENGKHVVLLLDEIDLVKDLDQMIYTLTRVNDDLREGSLTLVGVSNKVGFTKKLDTRTRSSLCEEELVFQSYNANQLSGILKQRAEKSFHDGIVDDSAINIAAAIAAADNGDARYALMLLVRAGELAERSKLQKITDKQVEESRKAAEEDKAFEIISSLPEHQQFVMYGLAKLGSDNKYKRLVEDGGDKLYFSGEVYEAYVECTRKFGREPRTSRWYREYLHELDMLGLISTVQSGKGIRGQTTLIRSSYEPARIKKSIEKTFSGE
ncbi:MAG TPA: AAA family ATPase [Candidatus Norongarragalinales archaeon]|nr:AAA family ATPase [Candidatus Norongarragalinales archaeon]